MDILLSQFDALDINVGCSRDFAKLCARISTEMKANVGDETEFKRICDIMCTGRGKVLHLAAELGKLQICQFLIENVKVEIDVLTHSGDTPLMLAVKEEHVEIVKYLISKNGALVHKCNFKGFTSLHYAVEKESKELMEFLLDNGAPMEADSVVGTPLQYAASCGSVMAVDFLLERHAEPNSEGSLFESPLICAIRASSFECMKSLLGANANPNWKSSGCSPLELAAKLGDIKFLKCLLDYGADADDVGSEMLLPILTAALARNDEGVKVLLPKTFKIPDIDKWSVDGIMAYCHSDAAKKQLEGCRSETFLNGLKALADHYMSVKEGSKAVNCFSEGLIRDPSKQKWLFRRQRCFFHLDRGEHALRDAEQLVQLNQESGMNHYFVGTAWNLLQQHNMGAAALKKAYTLAPASKVIELEYEKARVLSTDGICTCGAPKIIDASTSHIKFRTFVTTENMNSSSNIDAIIKAVSYGDLSKLKEIKRNVGDEIEFRRICDLRCTRHGKVLHLAAKLGQLKICQFLIENVKVEIDVLTHSGDTPLMLAIKGEHGEIVKYLISKNGALVRKCNFKGFTPLHYAVHIGSKELMEFLLDNGAPMEADSVLGTPLQYAASGGCVMAVDFLLKRHAEPNLESSFFESPLICAIKASSLKCMKLLLKANANPKQESLGSYPLAHAAKLGNPKFLELLLDAGADPNTVSSADMMRPIEGAALVHNREAVELLLPRTSMFINDWSVEGIISHVHSEETKRKVELYKKDLFELLGDFCTEPEVGLEANTAAAQLCSQAMMHDALNPKWISQRFKIFERMRSGVHALRDAGELVRLSPESGMAYFRLGCAWKLLHQCDMAAEAFKLACELSPGDESIKGEFEKARRLWSDDVRTCDCGSPMIIDAASINVLH